MSAVRLDDEPEDEPDETLEQDDDDEGWFVVR